ncbi:MAG: response regulator [Planctomycetes bacterium]|nr:response regulator [Planctomycetota bacterium]
MARSNAARLSTSLSIAPSQGAIRLNNGVILLVEDNPDDVALTLRAFKKNHILNEIVVARDGVEALDYLFGTGEHAKRDTSHLPAVMLLDLKLPRVDGHEVLRRVRGDPRTKLLQVVVLTSSKEDQDVIQSYHLGANSYIRKPVDFDQFIVAIGQLGLYWLLLNETPRPGSEAKL